MVCHLEIFKAWDTDSENILLVSMGKFQPVYLLVIPGALDQGDWSASTSSGKKLVTAVATRACQKDQ